MRGVLTWVWRGMAFGLGMALVSVAVSFAWVWYRGPQTVTLVPPGASPEAVEQQLRRDIAAYNANLAQISTPQIRALGMSLEDRTIVTRFMMTGFVAPGERNDVAQQLRRRHFAEVCGRQNRSLRAGYRFVYSYADVVGGEIRIVLSGTDC